VWGRGKVLTGPARDVTHLVQLFPSRRPGGRLAAILPWRRWCDTPQSSRTPELPVATTTTTTTTTTMMPHSLFIRRFENVREEEERGTRRD